jgi:hypothetical protein
MAEISQKSAENAARERGTTDAERGRMKIVLAFLAFLVPAAVGWIEYFSLPPPQPQAVRDLTDALDDARVAHRFEDACARLAELSPYLEQMASGGRTEATREAYGSGLALVRNARERCPTSFAGAQPPDIWDGRLRRIVSGLHLLNTSEWSGGRWAPYRLSLFLVLPVEIVLGLMAWRWRRRERLLLETA